MIFQKSHMYVPGLVVLAEIGEKRTQGVVATNDHSLREVNENAREVAPLSNIYD
jgi:hypothetical protein